MSALRPTPPQPAKPAADPYAALSAHAASERWDGEGEQLVTIPEGGMTQVETPGEMGLGVVVVCLTARRFLKLSEAQVKGLAEYLRALTLTRAT